MPVPASAIGDASSKRKEGGRGQKLIYSGKTMSLAPAIRETNQLPKPPIIIESTIMKIITNA